MMSTRASGLMPGIDGAVGNRFFQKSDVRFDLLRDLSDGNQCKFFLGF